jgi:hypothetical protein
MNCGAANKHVKATPNKEIHKRGGGAGGATNRRGRETEEDFNCYFSFAPQQFLSLFHKWHIASYGAGHLLASLVFKSRCQKTLLF